MIPKKYIIKIRSRICHNIVAIVLVVIFFLLYILFPGTENTFVSFGATGIEFSDGEYYRWITCLFLHYNLRHLLANSAAILAVGSVLGQSLKKWQTLFIFLSGGILAEFAFSMVITDLVYDIGASSGIFALIACLIVCVLRFPERFHLTVLHREPMKDTGHAFVHSTNLKWRGSPFTWYRLDVFIIIVYFVFANTSVSAFLVHTFGFTAGIIISFILVLTGKFL